jgi:hypothetical protein
MDITAVRAFFMWCTIINVSLLVIFFLTSVYAGDWAYRIHSKWWPIPRETFNVAMYCFMGLFKIFVFVFNLVPYVALVIIG